MNPVTQSVRAIIRLSRRIRRKIRQTLLQRKNPRRTAAPRAFSPLQEKIDAVHDRLPPRFLLFDINQLCNLRCTHCDVWKNRKDEVCGKMSDERLGELFAEFKALSPYGATVTCGGEPMIDSDRWFRLCRSAHGHGLPIYSVTNGTFIQTPAMADQILLEGADEISVSLDHYRPEIHDRLRGIPGSFDKAVRAVRLLLEARVRHPEHSKPIMVMGLIGNTVYRELEAFYDFVLNDLGADKLKLNFIQPSFSVAGENDFFFEEEGGVDERQLREILDRCDRRFAVGMNPAWKEQVVMYFRSISQCRSRIRGWHSGAQTEACICNSVDRNIVVDIDGTARFCFARNFHSMPLREPGDMATFWGSRKDWRKKMLSCNLCCAISHSMRSESCTLAGVRKAEQFIENSLR
jgi:MoaA/NifB/PqqE/SkfB family radical SAM enzyme